MTQEEKQLLLTDLCARLPYEVCAELPNHHLVMHTYFIQKIDISNGWTEGVLHCAGRKQYYSAKIEDVKPYLRPMSSMTEEEWKEYRDIICCLIEGCEGWNEVDWLNKHHFDYRGLIEKGLAIEVTEENNPYKEQ